MGKTLDSNAWSVERNSVLHHSFTKKENLTSFFLPDFMEENSQKKIYLQDLKWMAKKKRKKERYKYLVLSSVVLCSNWPFMK